jgi:phosphoribosylformimino-5-aminoimidazole carboxamide ribotide isomerase
MRLIPVLDVMNGVVVRGVGGRRSEYRPIVSRLISSAAPLAVARALVGSFHPRELYLADLDAIAGTKPALALYRGVIELGIRVWVDAGVRDPDGAKRVAAVGCNVVAGLETVPSPAVLAEIVAAVEADRVVFSLDLRDGLPLRDWGEQSPLAVAATAVRSGITRLIVLDLAHVGRGTGTGTDELCREIALTYSHVEVIAGGGIAGPEDLKRLAAGGVKAVLVASALHDGRIQPVSSTEFPSVGPVAV